MMSIQEIQAGTVVGHRYRIEKSLGRGPSGTVYICRDLLDGGGNVSVKVIRMKDCGECQMAQLRRQLSVLARLRHPNLARILDFGTIAERNEPFLVQEYVDGKNLFEATGDRVSHEMIRLLVELCRALRYLHAREVLHCNLKPSNVLLSPGNGGGAGIKLLDFGLNGLPRGSKRESMLGTLGYTAPEVILGQPPTIKSDLYSLGVVAYQLFARRLPFEDEDHEYLIQKQLQGSADLRPIERLESGPGLVQVLRGLLEKDPDRRPSSTDEVIRLLSVASGRDFSSVIEPSREHYFSASRFVGRDNELRTLQGACNEIRQSGRGAAYFITGEAGLGKTRLLEELRTWCLMDGWRVIEAGCLPGEGESYEVYRKILHRFDRVGAAAQGASVDEIFRFESLPRPAEAGLLQPSTESAASRFRDHLTRELVKRLSDAPSVLLLHDFHWADDANTAVLDYLISDISVQPVFVCVSIRPLKDEQSPLARLMKQAARHQRAGLLTLDPLPEDAVAQMIVSMTGSKELGKSVGNWLYTSSGGNPYFVEETMKHLVDRGVLRQEADRWVLEQSQLQNLEVPKGAAVVLRHRLDQLSTTARGVADWISVIKRPVALDLLCRVLSWDAGKARAVLGELIMRQLVRVSEEGASEQYEFRHSLIAEVLYAGIGRSRRRRMHGKIAEVMESLYGPDGCLQELAIHFTEGRVGKKAVGYALKAASLCRAEFAYETALRFFEYVLTNPGDLSREEQCQASIDAADIHCALGIPRRAIRLLETQHGGRQMCPDSHAQTDLALCLSRCFQFAGDMTLSRKKALDGLRILRNSHPDPANKSRKSALLAQLAFCKLTKADTGRGLAIARRALRLIEERTDPILFGHLHILVSGLSCVACDFHEGRQSALVAIESLRAVSAIHLLPIAYSHLGINLAGMGKFSLAAKYHEEALTLAQTTRSVVLQAQAMCNLAECYHRSGRFQEASRTLSEMRRVTASVENPQLAMAGQLCLAEKFLNCGDYSRASENLLASGSKLYAELPEYSRSHSSLITAWLKLETGLIQESLESLSKLSLSRSKGVRPFEAALAEILRARALVLQGKNRDGLKDFERMSKRMLRKGWAYHLCLAKIWLAEACLQNRHHRLAIKHSAQALRLSKAMPALHLEALCHLLLARTSVSSLASLVNLRDSEMLMAERARMHLERAIAIAQQLGLESVMSRARLQLASLDELEEDSEGTIANANLALEHLKNAEALVPPKCLEKYRRLPEVMDVRAERERLHHKYQGSIAAAHSRLVGMESEQLRALLKTSVRLSTVWDLDSLTRLVTELSLELTDYERAIVFIRQDDSRSAKFAGGLRSDGTRFKEADSVILSIAKEVCEQNRPFLVADSSRAPRWPGLRLPVSSSAGSILCGPLRSRGRALGVVYVDTLTPRKEFPESLISLFAAFCSVAATAIDNSMAHRRLNREKAELEQHLLHAKDGFIEILGESAVIRELRHQVQSIANAPMDVLICGETGTGKELIARALHRNSVRGSGSFVAVDCGALSDTLIESELFGCRRGAFTGANEGRAGLIESANGGVLFLDEIANLPLRLQPKLLRVLQERVVRRIGEVLERKLDIRVFAATNKDLTREMQRGKFRRDLYYRLRAAEIRIPPLRERREDIPLLIEWFLARIIQMHGQPKRFTAEALVRLVDYGYPGNVRQLMSLVESAYYAAQGELIEMAHLHPEVLGEVDNALLEPHQEAERLYDLIRSGDSTFDSCVKKPFLKRVLTSQTVRLVISLGLRETNGRYRSAFRLLRIPDKDYAVMMLFLKRHHCFVDFRPFRHATDI
jgi:transcriptional regulator with GAF, ATPase, and Fis domain